MRDTRIEIKAEPALDVEAVLRFFQHRTVRNLELVEAGTYNRSIRLDGELGCLRLDLQPERINATAWTPNGPDAGKVEARIRRMFDLESDLAEVHAHLGKDPSMKRLLELRPTLRIPGGWDPFEIAIRTVMGQQVSVQAACLLNARLVDRCGEDLAGSPIEGITRVFPSPEAVVAADLSNMGMPGARVNALKNVAQAVIDDPGLFAPLETAEETVAKLCRVKGIGEWSAQYIAMRACRQFDAFPASDIGILRGLADENGVRPTAKEALARAEAWRPWRAYAAHHIWASDADKARD